MGGFVRSITWDEFETFKRGGELPDPGLMPRAKEEMFSFYGF
jgi:hypothetical protein